LKPGAFKYSTCGDRPSGELAPLKDVGVDVGTIGPGDGPKLVVYEDLGEQTGAREDLGEHRPTSSNTSLRVKTAMTWTSLTSLTRLTSSANGAMLPGKRPDLSSAQAADSSSG
jgi:hypothetical protein